MHTIRIRILLQNISTGLELFWDDQNILGNYRPISNLRFLSKVLERVVAARLVAYVEENKLSEPSQSAYRKGHSTETALVGVQHDILNAIGGQQAVLLVLLDLSAAIDTVSHAELISTLHTTTWNYRQSPTVVHILPNRP